MQAQLADAVGLTVGALKDYGVETSQDLMALLLQLEEGYGLVPSEDGTGLAVGPGAACSQARAVDQVLGREARGARARRTRRGRLRRLEGLFLTSSQVNCTPLRTASGSPGAVPLFPHGIGAPEAPLEE